MAEKTMGEELKEKLFDTKKNGWEKTSQEQGKAIFNYCNGYIIFLYVSYTERELVYNSCKIAREHGFISIEEYECL